MAEVKARLTVNELAYWIADYEIDPWGERRADVREACIGAAIASTHASRAVKPADLLPEWDRKARPKLTRGEWEAFVQAHNERQKGVSGK